MKAALFATAMLSMATSTVSQQCGCTSIETCCMDSAGYSCCLNDETYCVQEGSGYPARCCERWTVGCSVGSVGCCDPARAYQRSFESSNTTDAATRRTSTSTSTSTSTPVHASNSTYFALLEGGVDFKFEVATITATGHITHRQSVSGPAKTWIDSLYGESTRVFPFDTINKMFHFLDGSDTTHPTLYSISTNGSSTSKVLNTVTGYPLGFGFHQESGSVVFSVLREGKYSFYDVDPMTGVTTTIGTVAKGSTEGDDSFYSGYITGVSLKKTTVFRAGYKGVTTQAGPGMGLTDIGSGVSKWVNVSVPESNYFYYSVDRLVGSDSYVSLAPTKGGDNSFDVVLWNQTSSSVVGHAPNSHPPSFRDGNLGYIATAQSDTTFGAVVVYHESEKVHIWGFLTADLTTKQLSYSPLTPSVLSGTTSISGFGISN